MTCQGGVPARFQPFAASVKTMKQVKVTDVSEQITFEIDRFLSWRSGRIGRHLIDIDTANECFEIVYGRRAIDERSRELIKRLRTDQLVRRVSRASGNEAIGDDEEEYTPCSSWRLP
jgi:hypothetical protein